MDIISKSAQLRSDTKAPLSLLDQDEKRRAAISFWLSGAGFTVQPFQSVDELFERPRPSGLVLVADDGDTLAELLTHPLSLEYSVRFVAYSPKIDVRNVVQAMRHGAIDYVEWPNGKTEMENAIRSAEQRWQTLDWPRRQTATSTAPNQPHPLTKRELEVMQCLREGNTSRQAADKLGISVRTVDIYCGNIRRKYGVRRIVDAIAIFNGADPAVAPSGQAPGAQDRTHNADVHGHGDTDGETYEGMDRRALAQARISRLTKREAEVLALVANGLSNWQIAEQLKISRRTVETHRYNLIDKMEMKNIAVAIRLAAESGLV